MPFFMVDLESFMEKLDKEGEQRHLESLLSGEQGETRAEKCASLLQKQDGRIDEIDRSLEAIGPDVSDDVTMSLQNEQAKLMADQELLARELAELDPGNEYFRTAFMVDLGDGNLHGRDWVKQYDEKLGLSDGIAMDRLDEALAYMKEEAGLSDKTADEVRRWFEAGRSGEDYDLSEEAVAELTRCGEELGMDMDAMAEEQAEREQQRQSDKSNTEGYVVEDPMGFTHYLDPAPEARMDTEESAAHDWTVYSRHEMGELSVDEERMGTHMGLDLPRKTFEESLKDAVPGTDGASRILLAKYEADAARIAGEKDGPAEKLGFVRSESMRVLGAAQDNARDAAANGLHPLEQAAVDAGMSVEDYVAQALADQGVTGKEAAIRYRDCMESLAEYHGVSYGDYMERGQEMVDRFSGDYIENDKANWSDEMSGKLQEGTSPMKPFVPDGKDDAGFWEKGFKAPTGRTLLGGEPISDFDVDPSAAKYMKDAGMEAMTGINVDLDADAGPGGKEAGFEGLSW